MKKARNPKGGHEHFVLVPLEDGRGKWGASFSHTASVPADVPPGLVT